MIFLKVIIKIKSIEGLGDALIKVGYTEYFYNVLT